jgi:hypothetical protein
VVGNDGSSTKVPGSSRSIREHHSDWVWSALLLAKAPNDEQTAKLRRGWDLMDLYLKSGCGSSGWDLRPISKGKDYNRDQLKIYLDSNLDDPSDLSDDEYGFILRARKHLASTCEKQRYATVKNEHYAAVKDLANEYPNFTPTTPEGIG